MPADHLQADKDDEIFEVVDDQDRVLGTEKRSICHTSGLLHRAVYCWVFNSHGQLLIQRRSPHKKIGPGQWDLSVAEHLQPGESFKQAAVRGLQEELGVVVPQDTVTGPLAPTHRRELHQGEFHDVELVQSYRLGGYDGSIAPDPGEVCEVAFVHLQQLQERVASHPHLYTQWLREEGAALGWFG